MNAWRLTSMSVFLLPLKEIHKGLFRCKLFLALRQLNCMQYSKHWSLESSLCFMDISSCISPPRAVVLYQFYVTMENWQTAVGTGMGSDQRVRVWVRVMSPSLWVRVRIQVQKLGLRSMSTVGAWIRIQQHDSLIVLMNQWLGFATLTPTPSDRMHICYSLYKTSYLFVT